MMRNRFLFQGGIGTNRVGQSYEVTNYELGFIEV